MESKLHGHTDSDGDHSSHLGCAKVLHQSFKLFLLLIISSYISLKFNIDFVIFGCFLRFTFSQKPRHRIACIIPVAEMLYK